MSEHAAEPHVCCGHDVQWHHATRGCGYHGFAESARCECRLTPSEVVARHRAEAAETAEADANKLRLVAGELTKGLANANAEVARLRDGIEALADERLDALANRHRTATDALLALANAEREEPS